MATKKKTTKKVTKTTGKKAKKSTMKMAAKTTTKKAATKKKTTKKTAVPRKMATKKANAKTATAKKVTAVKSTTPKATAKMSQQVTSDKAMAAHNQAPKIGQEVPNFEVEATGGQRVTLQGLRGKNVVLYFYPKDATPGCTIEGHEFTKLHDEFKALGTEVYGVSRDDLNSHEKFKTTQCYTIDLLSDTKSELCNMFDVIKLKNMYGKQVQGIERSTFVIDTDGKLAQEWRGVKAEGHAQQVLDFLRQQNS